MKRALPILDASVDWPATVATDGGGVRDRMRTVNAAARQGDVSTVDDELAVNCDFLPLEGVR
jgi:hypothetical protein